MAVGSGRLLRSHLQAMQRVRVFVRVAGRAAGRVCDRVLPPPVRPWESRTIARNAMLCQRAETTITRHLGRVMPAAISLVTVGALCDSTARSSAVLPSASVALVLAPRDSSVWQIAVSPYIAATNSGV